MSINNIFSIQQSHRIKMRKSSAAERRGLLAAFRKALIQFQPKLLDALHKDLGKNHSESMTTEIHQVLEGIRHSSKMLSKWMKPKIIPGPISMPGIWSEIVPEPCGTVLILGPWNYPVANLLSPFVDALAAGNTVILKPSERAPRVAGVIQELIESVFKPNLVAVIQGEAPVARELTALPFDHILFTGNTEIGRKVMEAASKNLSPVTLELGGKSPVVISSDAQLDLAAKRIAWGKFLNAGQACISPDYVLVPRSMQGEFIKLFKGAVSSMYPDAKEGYDFGRLIDANSVSRLKNLSQASVVMGASLELGGEFDEEARFISPTLLGNVTRDMPIMSQEIFGPVLPVLPYDNLSAALEEINLYPTPLALYAFGGNSFAKQCKDQVRSGGMAINGVMIHITDHRLPFGGLGASGLGSYHGEHGFRTFSHYRAVVHETAFSLTHLGYPPFNRWQTKFANIFLSTTGRL